MGRAKHSFEQTVAAFWSRVKKTDGCWLWRGSVTPTGYGTFYGRGRTESPHTFAYELLVGAIPEGMQLDHLCHGVDPTCIPTQCVHRRCVNPAHLEPVIELINHRRGQNAKRSQTHCVAGHPLIEGNIYWHHKGGYSHRYCRACRQRRSRSRNAQEQQEA